MARLGWKTQLALLLLCLLHYTVAREHRASSLEKNKHTDAFRVRLSEEKKEKKEEKKEEKRRRRREEKKEEKEEEEKEEEEREESFAGYTAGCATIGGFSLVTAIFYLINNPRTVVRKIIWEVVNNTVSIFCAVFIYQTVSRLLGVVYDQVRALKDNTNLDWDYKADFEIRRYINQGEVCFWYGAMYAFMSLTAGVGMGMWFRLSTIKDKLSYIQDKVNVRICSMFAHVCAFANIEGWGKVQTTHFRSYYKSPVQSMLPLWECWLKWMAILVTLGILRRKIKYNFIQFWKLGSKVMLHYNPQNPRHARLHGKIATLEEYDPEDRVFTVSLERNGAIVKKKVKLEHIGAAATVTEDRQAVGPDFESVADGIRSMSAETANALRDVGREKSREAAKSALERLSMAGKDAFKKITRMGTSEQRNSVNEEARLFAKETGHLGIVDKRFGDHAGKRHWVFSGNKVVESDSIKQGDDVAVICNHHFSWKSYRRLDAGMAVVQKTAQHNFVKNVRWHRIQLKFDDPFAQGPWGHHDPMVEFWEEQLEEGENDIVALTTSFLLVQSLRFAVGGVLPNAKGEEHADALFAKTWPQVIIMMFLAYLLASWAYIFHPWLLKKMDLFKWIHKQNKYFRDTRMKLQKQGDHVPWSFALKEECFYVFKRAEEILGNCLVAAMCWCLMYGTQWALASKESAPVFGNRFTLSVWLAIFITFDVFFMIAILDPIITRSVQASSSKVDRIEKNLVQFVQSLGFLIGFTWESCFDSAIEEIAEVLATDPSTKKIDHTRETYVKAALSILSLLALIPAWQKFILPMVDEKEYTLGFHAQRIVANCKHGFDKSARAQEQKFKHERKEEEKKKRRERWKHAKAEEEGEPIKRRPTEAELERREKKARAREHTHAVKKLARHFRTCMKMLDESFVVKRMQSVRPSDQDLLEKDPYIKKVVVEARAQLNNAEHMIENRPHHEELRKIVDILDNMRLSGSAVKRARFQFRFKFDATAVQDVVRETTSGSLDSVLQQNGVLHQTTSGSLDEIIKRQVSDQSDAPSRCSSDQDNEESAESSDDDEEDKPENPDRASEPRMSSEVLLQRARALLDEWNKREEEVKHLKDHLAARAD